MLNEYNYFVNCRITGFEIPNQKRCSVTQQIYALPFLVGRTLNRSQPHYEFQAVTLYLLGTVSNMHKISPKK